ncbi:hypothetical protein DYB28_000218 [Aphanomyces astaci]|uniref:Uncharacterized protein n=1 Tax=Aphanomyces astaci TaxID=112090 RepID=A0A9X8DXM9_APHAT|nr:hypothetical protein DYB28_000218 [Aphanomyces astaci]
MGDWVFNFDDLQSELNVGPSAYIPPSFASSTNQPHPDTVTRSFQRRDAITSITEHEEWNVSTEDVQTDLDRTLETIRLQRTQEVYLAFVMDTTGSMFSHMHAVKTQIRAIAEA